MRCFVRTHKIHKRGFVLRSPLHTHFELASCTNVHFLECMCGSIPPHLFFTDTFLLGSLLISLGKLSHGEWGIHPHQELVNLNIWVLCFPLVQAPSLIPQHIRTGSTNWSWSYTAPTQQSLVEGRQPAKMSKGNHYIYLGFSN